MRLDDEQRLEITRLYDEGQSATEIAKQYGVNRATVRNIARKHGVHKTMSEAKTKYTRISSFFDVIDTEEKAYWLGYIAADGTIKKGNVLTLRCHEDDIELLHNFKKSLNYNGVIGRASYQKLDGTYTYNVFLNLVDRQIVNSLSKYGIVQNKHATVTIPKLPEELERHYIRGYFDGDGSVWLAKNSNQLSFSLTGNYEMVSCLRDILVKECDLNNNKISVDKRSENCCSVKYAGNIQVPRIAQYMYKDETLSLERKKNMLLGSTGK